MPVCAVADRRDGSYTARMRLPFLVLFLAACNEPGHSLPDAAMHVPLVDASPNACADDSVFEPNQTIATAWPTPVGTTLDSIAIAGLAICPASDTDHYGVSIATPRSIRATVSWDSGAPVRISILNAAGTSIMDGVPAGALASRACISNAPAGKYYPLVQTGNGTTNNYRLTIDLVPGC